MNKSCMFSNNPDHNLNETTVYRYFISIKPISTKPIIKGYKEKAVE